MPVLVGTHSTTPTSPPQQPILIEDVGFAVATWYAPDGSVWPLMDERRGWRSLAEGITGLDAAPISITSDDRPRGGGGVRHIQPEMRSITWALEVWSDESHAEFVARWRALMRAFTQTTQLGPGTLEIARPDGSARRIEAYYQEGWDGKTGLGVLSDQVVFTLTCEDPYWRDVVAQPVHREYSVGRNFLSPFYTLSSGQVLGDTTILVRGEVEAWPDWVITGPASLITATNQDTGESFALNPNAEDIGHGNLLAGQKVTISTRPPRVRYMDGSVWTGALNWPQAVLWSLKPGLRHVTFQLDGAGPGSAVDLSFFPRYEAA